MGSKRIAVAVLIIVILFVSAFVGTIAYYNGLVTDKNSQIASLDNQISNQSSEIANLTSQVRNLQGQITILTTANLTASISFLETPPARAYGSYIGFLNLDGSVANVGKSMAYNAGLHVVAYDAQGVLEINATVPLAFEEEFTNPFGYFQVASGLIGGSYSVTKLGAGQSAQIRLNIDHLGTVTNWTATPVWTNTP
jgi:hypothetical protein